MAIGERRPGTRSGKTRIASCAPTVACSGCAGKCAHGRNRTARSSATAGWTTKCHREEGGREGAARCTRAPAHPDRRPLPEGIWLKDTNDGYLTCKRRFETFLGASEAEIAGKTDYDFVPRELADIEAGGTRYEEDDQRPVAGARPSRTPSAGLHEGRGRERRIMSSRASASRPAIAPPCRRRAVDGRSGIPGSVQASGARRAARPRSVQQGLAHVLAGCVVLPSSGYFSGLRDSDCPASLQRVEVVA